MTGIPKEIWNRDMRAAGVTEAREGAAHPADVAKTAGDTERTTSKVYDRAHLAAARRFAEARKTPREQDVS
jgi:hypothetical protein